MWIYSINKEICIDAMSFINISILILQIGFLWKLIGICNDVWNHIQLLKCPLWKFIFLYTIYVCIYYFSLISLWLANGIAQFKCVRFMGMKPSMHWKHNLYATLNWNAKFLICDFSLKIILFQSFSSRQNLVSRQ